MGPVVADKNYPWRGVVSRHTKVSLVSPYWHSSPRVLDWRLGGDVIRGGVCGVNPIPWVPYDCYGSSGPPPHQHFPSVIVGYVRSPTHMPTAAGPSAMNCNRRLPITIKLCSCCPAGPNAVRHFVTLCDMDLLTHPDVEPGQMNNEN